MNPRNASAPASNAVQDSNICKSSPRNPRRPLAVNPSPVNHGIQEDILAVLCACADHSVFRYGAVGSKQAEAVKSPVVIQRFSGIEMGSAWAGGHQSFWQSKVRAPS